MDAYILSDADQRLAEFVDRLKEGEGAEIVRDGRVVARLIVETSSPFKATRHKAAMERIRAATSGMAVDPTDSVAEMRKQARY